MSVGYLRKLKGVPVRSLNSRLQAWQRNFRYPSAVRSVCSAGVVAQQYGHSMASSPLILLRASLRYRRTEYNAKLASEF